MKKYLLGAFLVIAMNLSAAKLSEIKGLENLRNYNEIKDTQVEKILNYDETINKDKQIADKCMDLWDIMFERQLGSVRKISQKLMER